MGGPTDAVLCFERMLRSGIPELAQFGRGLELRNGLQFVEGRGKRA